MDVFIDGIIYSLQRQGGISVYFTELARRLRARSIAVTFGLELPTSQPIAELLGDAKRTLRRARVLERWRTCRVDRPSIFHSSYYRRPASKQCPTVVTVHDFIYERFARGAKRFVHASHKKAAIRDAQAVICISEATRDDLLHFVGIRDDQVLHVIHNGVSGVYRPLADAAADRGFLLYVGERRGYKNFTSVAKAMEFLPGLDLVCVGGGPFRADEVSAWPKTVVSRIRHAGFISDSQLNVYYNKALCLAYPSSIEGFGIPVVEAMKAGCPVVSIRCKAVVEVGGPALTIAEAAEPRAIADAVHRLASDGYRRSAVERGLRVSSSYSWERTHDMTIDVYKTLGLTAEHRHHVPEP